jgi:hypothetical protein
LFWNIFVFALYTISTMASTTTDVSLDTIAPSKLINYVTKDRLIQFVSPPKYAEVEQRLRQQLGKSKPNLKDMKKHLAAQPKFVQSLRNHAVGQEAFDKYVAAVNRLRGMDRSGAVAVRKVMTQPRRRYQGCLATRLKPQDYEHCLDNYDNEQYDNMGLVPAALKQRVYDRGDVATRGILEQTLSRKGNVLSGIPASYRNYISKNPDLFKNYFEQRRHELGLMKSVMNNLSNEDKRKLQQYYAANKTIEPEKFSEIIRGLQGSSTPSKRQRPPTKGGRFNLEDRITNTDFDDAGADLASMTEDFGDQSISDALYQQ